MEDFNAIEQVRQRLIHSTDRITVTQLGATSRVNNELVRPVSAIAKKGITSTAISKLLFNLIHDFKYENIIELGTSFGINTMYMAAIRQVKVYTFEGCLNTANIAQNNFDELGYTNIDLIQGNINKTLKEFIHQNPIKVDLAFIDANHKLEPTINYFNQLLSAGHAQSIIIIDDIYWSSEMTQAWEQMKNHPEVTTSVDLYDVGLLFFLPELEKAHFKLML